MHLFLFQVFCLVADVGAGTNSKQRSMALAMQLHMGATDVLQDETRLEPKTATTINPEPTTSMEPTTTTELTTTSDSTTTSQPTTTTTTQTTTAGKVRTTKPMTTN